MTYATLAELQEQANVSDNIDNAVLTRALNAAIESIDDHCNRHFRVVSPSATPTQRLYADVVGGRVSIDDARSVTTVETRGSRRGDWTAVDADDYELRPLNAETDSRPYTRLVLYVPSAPFQVRVTGRFGWPATPAVVKQATLLQAARWARRRDAPFGIANLGMDEPGMRLLAKLDADVELMLRGLRRRPVLVG